MQDAPAERRQDNKYLFDKLEQCIRLQIRISDQQQNILDEQKEIHDRMDEHAKVCKGIDDRLNRMERYEFAAKVIAWFVGGVAFITAGLVHFWNDIQEAFGRK